MGLFPPQWNPESEDAAESESFLLVNQADSESDWVSRAGVNADLTASLLPHAAKSSVMESLLKCADKPRLCGTKLRLSQVV